MSVRKAHNSGRNHLRNVVDYYQRTSTTSLCSSAQCISILLRSLSLANFIHRDRPREGTIRHRLHYLLLRRRRPSRRQPNAPFQPRRRPRLPTTIPRRRYATNGSKWHAIAVPTTRRLPRRHDATARRSAISATRRIPRRYDNASKWNAISTTGRLPTARRKWNAADATQLPVSAPGWCATGRIPTISTTRRFQYATARATGAAG